MTLLGDDKRNGIGERELSVIWGAGLKWLKGLNNFNTSTSDGNAIRVEKMPQENYRRITKGYDPKEPTTIGEQLFYILWCFLRALKILGRRIWYGISGKIWDKNK